MRRLIRMLLTYTLILSVPTLPADEIRKQGFIPTPGVEASEFREVAVFIRVDFDRGTVEVEADPADENVLCGIPRIFSPPDGKGIAETYHLRPAKPARQIRWIVQCSDGTGVCMQRNDRVVIRPKVAGGDPFCEAAPEIEDCPFMSEGTSFLKPAMLDQSRSLFHPTASGTFVIPADCAAAACRPGSGRSGFPDPVFPPGVHDLIWSYQVELWRGDVRVGCLDPAVWIETDD